MSLGLFKIPPRFVSARQGGVVHRAEVVSLERDILSCPVGEVPVKLPVVLACNYYSPLTGSVSLPCTDEPITCMACVAHSSKER